jgi:tripartite-type tricarboxylate transporter receptor subunit TctC
VLVTRGDLPVQNVRDLVALLNQKRDRPLTYGSNGNGTSVHLAAAMFSLIAGVEMLHVPYKGSAPVVAAILGGEVDVAYVSILDIMPHIRPGGVRALATGGSRRSDAMPNVPTIAEAGYPGAESAAWFGILAPAHTPREIINRLNLEFNKALKTPSVRQRLSPNGDTELIGGSPEEFARFIGAEIAKWTKVIKDGHIKPD